MAIGAAVGVGMCAVGLVRTGGYVVATSLAMGAVLRAVLPLEAAGGIAVRRRWLDVVALGGLAVTVFMAFTLVAL